MHYRRLLTISLFVVACSLAVGKVRKLKIIKLKEIPEEGCTIKTKTRDQLTIHYTGTLEDGTQFESSHDEGRTPATFQIGVNEVIQGWDEGMLDMCVGEKRRLTIPASMGYGDTGQKHVDGAGKGNIPGGATIIFEVELLKIEDGAPPVNVFKEMDADGDNLLSPEEVSYFVRQQETVIGLKKVNENDHMEMISEIFQNEDKDKDGLISESEFASVKDDDADHDEL